MNIRMFSIVLCFAGIAVAQTPASTPSAKHDVGAGAGDIGMGAAKAAGSAAKGTGKAAVDLVTMHPINAATDLGRGAAATGKNVGVGTVKGTGKMFRGAGKAIRHLF